MTSIIGVNPCKIPERRLLFIEVLAGRFGRLLLGTKAVSRSSSLLKDGLPSVVSFHAANRSS